MTSENRLTKVKKFDDKNISLAPLLGCAIPTAWGILNKESSISKSDSILIFGAGGLGSPVAVYLALAGIATIGLVDFDTVDVSNLQRQILLQN